MIEELCPVYEQPINARVGLIVSDDFYEDNKEDYNLNEMAGIMTHIQLEMEEEL